MRLPRRQTKRAPRISPAHWIHSGSRRQGARRPVNRSAALTPFLAFALLTPQASAAGGAGARATDAWRFEFTPYLWFPNISGTIATDPLPTATFETPELGLLDNVEFATSATFTARDDDWVVLSDFSYTKLGLDENISGSNLSIDSAVYWAMIAGGHSIASGPAGRIDLFGGFRYTFLDGDIESSGGVSGSNRNNQDWFDPLVGFDASAKLAERWSVGLLADIGGFGVGSDLAYEIWPRVSWGYNEIITLNVGYRLLAMDFERSDVTYDVTEAGWIVGVGLAF